MGSFMFRDEHRASMLWTSTGSLFTLVLLNSRIPLRGTGMGRLIIYLFCNLWQGERGEAGPPGRGERGDPGAPGPKVSYSYVGGELSLVWGCMPLAVEYATNSSTDAKTTQITSTSLKCTLMLVILQFNSSCLLCAAQWRNLIAYLNVKGEMLSYNTPSLNVCYSLPRKTLTAQCCVHFHGNLMECDTLEILVLRIYLPMQVLVP